MSTENPTIQYRVEVQMDTGKWVQFNSTHYFSKETALERLAEVRSYYTDKTIGVRLTAAPVLEWTPVPVPLDEAVETLEQALRTRNMDSPYDRALRLVLDTLKETQK